MLTGLHLLLTYKCIFECDHCFVYAGPHAKGTFTLDQVRKVLDQAQGIPTVEWIYFEGGEPFLYYPLLIESLRLARDRGYETGVVTNAYWATTSPDAEYWLRPLRELEVADLSVSDDELHYPGEENLAKHAVDAATKLGLPVSTICTRMAESDGEADVRFRGRAVEKLAAGVPFKPWESFISCPYEDLDHPERVHLDAFGNVHLCQGLIMGNMWDVPLATLVAEYDPQAHPLCGPLVEGGPALLARRYGVEISHGCADACHLCYLTRLVLIDRFPQFLGPSSVYGLIET